MAAAAATFALVILLNGWADGAPASRGNAIDHISGFTSMENCNKAGEAIKKTSKNPDIVRTACVDAYEEPEAGNALVIIVNGWDAAGQTLGSGAQGNEIHHLSGYPEPAQCQAAADKIRKVSANMDVTKTVCVGL